mgnify:CR=1 FL=1
MQKESRNQKVQILRGIAIIAVVLIHTCPSGYWQVICRPFINYSVATFLFLSGYLTKTDNDNWPKFFKKRIFRVLLPYLLWTVLYSITSKGLDFSNIVKNILTAHSACTMYYILVYIQFVLLTPLLGKLAKSKYKLIGWFIAPIFVLIFKYYPWLTGQSLHPIFKLLWGNCCVGWFTFYYLGLLLGNNLIHIKSEIRQLFVFYILSIILQIAEGYWLLQLGENNCGTQIKLSSLLTSSIFALIAYRYINSTKYDFANNVLLTIGNYSFGIYLSHIMIMRLLSHIQIYKEIPYVINSVIVIFVSLVFVYYGSKICNTKINNILGFK